MPSGTTFPNPTEMLTVQTKLNRLHRRRLALLNLIRSVEEYLLVADNQDSLLNEIPKKPNLRVVYAKTLKKMIA